MRLAVAGFLHESNTFNPLKADRAAFAAQSLTFGDALLSEWRDAHHEVVGFLEAAGAEGFDAVPLLMAWATPSGPVTDAVFDEVSSALIDGLKRTNPDGLLLGLHGAMVTESHPDADAETLARVRAAFPTLPVGVTLDLHGNLPQRLVENCDLAVAYRTCPHVDQRECGRRAAALLARAVRGEVRPRQALAKPPLLLNIMTHDTSRPPLSEFMEATRRLEQRPGVLAASLLPGFAYADVHHMGPSVLVVTDADAALARALADELADALWQARERFDVRLPDAPTAVARALRAEK